MTVASNTVRKNKFVKQKIMQDSSGTSRYVTEIKLENKDHSFYKIFRTEKHRMLPKGLSGATREIIDYIIIDMNRDNLFLFYNEDIMAALEFSSGTVKLAKKVLLAKNLIRKARRHYMFNPYYACAVTGDDRVILMQTYNDLETPSEEEA